jgi:tetratricopeptide (TPR) repeat protein
VDVPFRLTRRDEPVPADAVLILGVGAGPVAAAVAQLGPLPGVFAVLGGFLLVPRDAVAAAVPGAVRLRRLAGDLYVPADADLIPTLLPDEAASLTRDRGLVVLPAGPVLAFDPTASLPVGRWVAPAAVRRSAWEPLPTPPDRAGQLTAIERPSPPGAALEILGSGRPDGAVPLPGNGDPAGTDVPDDARPPAGSRAARAGAAAKLGAGKVLAWFGKLAGLPGLARLGGNLARKAVEQVPRLGEGLFGKQEAALREVLRQLMEGDVEKALRRAPPAVADPDRPARIGTTADLGTRDTRYDLRSLIGGGGAGVAWLGGGDVWDRLAGEYRRLAREASDRGDFRRSAYLYGVLLRDPRSAANALLAGGLYRDAAVLFRDKVYDSLAAAAAFDQAGEYDEALRLYDRAGRFEAAGDLLRRLGDEGRARGYFTRAADALAGRREWVAAGDLLRRKCGDTAAAGGYYRRGWDEDGAESVACGERLLDELLSSADWPGAGRLFDAAEARYDPPRATEAGRFFLHARAVGELYLPPDHRDDLDDRARLLFARHLRECGPGAAGGLFARPGAWPAPVVRDATAAARARPRVAAHSAPLRLLDGPVCAVVVAPESGDIVVAGRGGIVAWRGQDFRVRRVRPADPGPLLGLSVSPDGGSVLTLGAVAGNAVARFYGVSGKVTIERVTELGPLGTPAAAWYLEPAAALERGAIHVTAASPRERLPLSGSYLARTSHARYLGDGGTTHLLVRAGDDRAWDWQDRTLRLLTGSHAPSPACRWLPHCTPDVPPGNSLTVPRVDWLTPLPGVLEVACVDWDGVAHWLRFDGSDPGNTAARTASTAHERFLAACLIQPGQVAAATDKNVVHWLRPDRTTLRPRAAVALDVPSPVVALVARGTAGDLVAVLADGTAVRVGPGGG